MKLFFTITLFLVHQGVYSQLVELPEIAKRDITTNKFALDSTANAIVLLEKGSTIIQKSDAENALMVFHRYAIRIKILNQQGLKHANYTLPLYKFGGTSEYTTQVKATSYKLNTDGSINQNSLKNKDILNEKVSEYVTLSKFTVPDVKPGSVIDIEYTIVSPDIFKFRTWSFQSEIPKLRSEYNAVMPAMFKYNVTLRGPLKIKDTKSKIYRECLFFNGAKMDCSDMTYIMENIPPFEEEDFMLATKNYLSAIHFELEEAIYPNGSSKQYTQKWSDVDRELLTDKSFGGQIKEDNFFKSVLPTEVIAMTDPMARANAIYTFIQNNIRWNKYYGKYSQNGVKRSFEGKSGNIADINLALIAALNAAEIDAYPVLVSTRENVIPNNLHPILSDFNYVIAGVKDGEKTVLLDASEPLLSFGELPLRTINDRGRIIYSRKSSEWIPLINPIGAETSYFFSGDLDPSGKLKGQLTVTYTGYDAFKKRQEVKKHNSKEEYEEKLDERLANIKINKLDWTNLDSINRPFEEITTIEVDLGNPIDKGDFLLNPIFINRTTQNPFNLDERTYPVDLGTKRVESYAINISFPKEITLKSAPSNLNLAIPDKGAVFQYRQIFEDNMLQVSQRLSLNKAIYQTNEYFSLKELFSRIIQHQKIDYIFSHQP